MGEKGDHNKCTQGGDSVFSDTDIASKVHISEHLSFLFSGDKNIYSLLCQG